MVKVQFTVLRHSVLFSNILFENIVKILVLFSRMLVNFILVKVNKNKNKKEK